MKTEIVLLLDESGSMSGLRDSVIEQVNNFIKEQRNVPGECSMTVVKFDHRYGPVFEGMDIHSVPMLTRENYSPNGNTALVGAIGKLIDETGKRFAAMKEADRPQKVLFIVQTDGGENYTRCAEWASSYNESKVAEMIQHQTDKYNWTFVFMGANQDSFLTGGSYNFAKGNTTDWDATAIGNAAVYRSLNNATRSYRTSNVVGTKNFFNG